MMEAMVEVGSSNGLGHAGDHDHDRDRHDDEVGTPKTACVETVCKITAAAASYCYCCDCHMYSDSLPTPASS